MARYEAISAVGETILQVLRDAKNTATDPFIRSITCALVSKPIPAARPLLGLYLHRVNPSSRSHQPDRPGAGGEVFRPVATVDLHYILIPWPSSASTTLAADQHVLLGWAIQALATSYQLPAALLNRHRVEPVFFDDESVEIAPETLSLQDLANIWEIHKPDIQISAAYLARMVTVHASVPSSSGGPVQTRRFDAGTLPERGTP